MNIISDLEEIICYFENVTTFKVSVVFLAYLLGSDYQLVKDREFSIIATTVTFRC